jgi:hypothetical protein
MRHFFVCDRCFLHHVYIHPQDMRDHPGNECNINVSREILSPWMFKISCSLQLVWMFAIMLDIRYPGVPALNTKIEAVWLVLVLKLGIWAQYLGEVRTEFFLEAWCRGVSVDIATHPGHNASTQTPEQQKCIWLPSLVQLADRKLKRRR